MNTRVEAEIRGFDFHCHIDLQADPLAVLERCERDGILTLAVTTTPKAWPQNRKWTERSSCVLAAPGLHPELVADRYHEIALLEHHIGLSRVVGEVGLDGSPQHRKAWSKQIEVFARVLRSAEDHGGRAISIHSRRAADETVRLIAKHTTPARTLCILHWYSGSMKTAREAAGLGCYFSVNQQMLENDRGLSLLRTLPPDRLLTETDSPFTSRGERKSRPDDVVYTVERMAAALNVSRSEMDRRVWENATRVLKFAGHRL